MVWFTGNRNNRIVRLDPATGKLTTFMIPDTSVRDPHTLIFTKDGIGWFSAQQSQRIGRIDTKTGEIKLWRPPGEGRTNPYGVVIDQTNRPFFNLWATNKIATIDPKTLEYKEYVHPDERMRARRIAITSDGQIYVVADTGTRRASSCPLADPDTSASAVLTSASIFSFALLRCTGSK